MLGTSMWPGRHERLFRGLDSSATTSPISTRPASRPDLAVSRDSCTAAERRGQGSAVPRDRRRRGCGADQQDFRQGELRETDNTLDAAIDGNGFFVLERDGESCYTRAGQFEINKNGILIERVSGAKVMIR